MKQKLEMATSVAIIGIALLIGYVLVRSYIFPRQPDANSLTRIRVGQRMTEFRAVNWGAHHRTLVLAVKKGCHYCEESGPFYKRLLDARASAHSDVSVVAILPDGKADAASYLTSEGLGVDFVPDVNLQDVGVDATPTLILVGSDGRVQKTWVGMLSPKMEMDVVGAITDSAGQGSS